MSRLAPALVAAGVALLLVPLARRLGEFGFVLFGVLFVLAGSTLEIREW